MSLNTYLLLLLIEVIDDDSNEEIEGEEGAKDDEEDKVDVHVDVDLADGLLPNLRKTCVWFFNIVVVVVRKMFEKAEHALPPCSPG